MIKKIYTPKMDLKDVVVKLIIVLEEWINNPKYKGSQLIDELEELKKEMELWGTSKST